MDKVQKRNLEAVIKGLINDDSKAAGEALHEYLRVKAQSILLGEQDEEMDKDEPVEKNAVDDMNDEDMDDKDMNDKDMNDKDMDDEDMDDEDMDDEDMDDEDMDDEDMDDETPVEK